MSYRLAQDEHLLTPQEVAQKFNTHIAIAPAAASTAQGLTEPEAAARLAKDGPNVLTPPKKKSAFRKVSGWVGDA